MIEFFHLGLEPEHFPLFYIEDNIGYWFIKKWILMPEKPKIETVRLNYLNIFNWEI